MILAGDIGGTKTMLAVFSASPAAGRGADRRALGFERDSGVVETYDSRDFAHFDEILRDFCARHRPQLRAACIGVAGPVRKNRCSATHLPWTIDGAELARSLGLGGCALLNDLAAVGYGIDVLREDEIEELQAGAPGASGNRAVIAAGTGLGEAGLFWDGAAHRPFATEGGHADFAPQDELEIGLLRFLQQEREPVSWERVVSGPGLVSIFRFLLDLQPAGARAEGAPGLAGMAEAMTSAEPAAWISRRARSGDCALSARALDLFVKLYGAEAGNLALKTMATGGVYIGGGIAAKNLPWMRSGSFVEAFCSKDRMRPLLEAMPVRLILNDQAALLGAARHAATRLEAESVT
jgi:glucokinase